MNPNREKNFVPDTFARISYNFFGLKVLEIEGVRLFYKIKKEEKTLHVANFFNSNKRVLGGMKVINFLKEIKNIMKANKLEKLEFVPVNEKLKTISSKLGAKEIDVDFPEELSEKFFKKHGSTETKHQLTLEQIEKILER